ncbi:sensor histidine kinase [Treponema brennaborense]|nr:histidine kinase [Treponema brennaborense]
MIFSKRLVLVYTCIIVIPLFLLVIGATNYIRNGLFEELRTASMQAVTDHAELINGRVDSFVLIESVIRANDELMFLVTKPESDDESQLISAIIDEVSFMSRLMFVVPDICAVRMFTDNPLIPERWPFILHSNRTDLAALDKWEYNYAASYMGNQDRLKAPSVCTTRRLVRNGRELGYIQIAMFMEDFFPFLYKADSPFRADYVFTVQADALVPVTAGGKQSVHPELTAAERSQLASAAVFGTDSASGLFTMNSGRSTKIAAWRTIPRMNLLVAHVCSTDMIRRQLFLFRGGTVAALLVTICLLFFIISVTTKRLMARIYSVMDRMRQVRNGKLDVTVPVDGNDEVAEMQQTFNAMTEQLREQIDQICKEQALVAETEIKAMQNQINAHFLYNILETIKMQAVLADQNDIAESVTVLGKMMRYCLRWRVHRVTVQQEIEYICSYVYILNLRNDYVISLETEIAPEFQSLEILKMILQPVIENAFMYAVEPAGKDAVIRVYTEPDESCGRVWLCVRDFGCGMDEQKLETIRQYLSDDSPERNAKGSIGLKNIQQRLDMFYGSEYRIKLESEKGKGTLVCIPVPLEHRL